MFLKLLQDHRVFSGVRNYWHNPSSAGAKNQWRQFSGSSSSGTEQGSAGRVGEEVEKVDVDSNKHGR